jgi:hypothetical protein
MTIGNIASASQSAVQSFLEEARETAAETAREAAKGDVSAIQKLFRLQALAKPPNGDQPAPSSNGNSFDISA